MTDWIKGAKPKKYTLATSRILSVFWAAVLIFGATLFTSTESPLVEVGLSIASFTYGGLLGFFVLGRSTCRYSRESVVTGFITSLLAMVTVVSFTEIACLGIPSSAFS